MALPTIYPKPTDEERAVAEDMARQGSISARVLLFPEGWPRPHVTLAHRVVQAELARREQEGEA